MDSSPPNDQASGSQAAAKPSIDSLRTVEFRTTLRGYHMDDVDEYLERVAVEAEALQEQVRLASERVNKANERADEPRTAAGTGSPRPAGAGGPAGAEPQSPPTSEHDEISDDSLQRTLLLAQKFVDQTRQEAEREASELLASSEARARSIVDDAEEHVRVMTEDAERNLREEVKRLDSHRAELVADVETIAHHLESERARIRKALSEMLAWVDEHVQAPKSAGSRCRGSGRPIADQGEGPSRGARPWPGPGAGRRRGRCRSSGEADRGLGCPRLPGRRGSDRAAGCRRSCRTQGREETSESEPLRGDRDDIGITGLPTEKIPATSPRDPELDELEVPDEELAARKTGTKDQPTSRGSSDRSTPSHQRQMFAPGREPRQAGSGIIR